MVLAAGRVVKKMVLGIVKASLEILGIGIGVKKVVLLMSASYKVFRSHPSCKLALLAEYLGTQTP